MIKCETFGNGNLELEVKGSLEDVITDSAYIIASIYKEMKKTNKGKTNTYKMLFLSVVNTMFDYIDRS